MSVLFPVWPWVTSCTQYFRSSFLFLTLVTPIITYSVTHLSYCIGLGSLYQYIFLSIILVLRPNLDYAKFWSVHEDSINSNYYGSSVIFHSLVIVVVVGFFWFVFFVFVFAFLKILVYQKYLLAFNFLFGKFDSVLFYFFPGNSFFFCYFLVCFFASLFHGGFIYYIYLFWSYIFIHTNLKMLRLFSRGFFLKCKLIFFSFFSFSDFC